MLGSHLENGLPSFDELVSKARGGCAIAADQLFDRCRGYLLVTANQRLDDLLRPKIGGSDLVQQSLLHAYRDIDDFRGQSEGEFLSWLQAILANQIASARRHYLEAAKRDVSREVAFGYMVDSGIRAGSLPSDTKTPSRHAISHEEEARVQQAVARLSLSDQQVIKLRNRDLLSFAEIAARMSLGEEQVRRLWSRAIERLRQELVCRNKS